MISLDAVRQEFKNSLLDRKYEIPDYITCNEISEEITSKFDNLLDQVEVKFDERGDDCYFILQIGHKYNMSISNSELRNK